MQGNKEYVIVGAGLAGTVVAWTLYRKNIPFRIVDGFQAYASRAAAGIINPIVFRRLNMSWKADTLIPAAQSFYQDLERILDVKLLRSNHIRRIFTSVEEQNNWDSVNEFVSVYLNQDEVHLPPQILAPFGSGQVETVGHLHMAVYLDRSHNFFVDQGIQLEKKAFDYSEISESEEYIFCEGSGLSKNPFFNHLPLKRTHGEVLVIECEELEVDEVLNHQLFVQPLGNHRFKIGATYNWELKEPVTTEEGRQDILDRFERFVKADYKIIDHLAGVRPTVSDRRPLIGTHSNKGNLHLFNGLGTKGVMIAPYYADQFSDFLQGKTTLDEEVNISRFED